MKPNVRVCIGLLLAILPITSAFAQKVNVGYDKGADFSRYTNYTWIEPGAPPAKPLLYATMVASIDHELKAKGLARTQSDGGLIVIPAGGIEFGFNTAGIVPILPTYNGTAFAFDATMWTGAGGLSGSMATYVPEGTLMLTFVDRSANKVIWTGTVSLKLDMERKNKSLELIDKAITKLLKGFPPGKK